MFGHSQDISTAIAFVKANSTAIWSASARPPMLYRRVDWRSTMKSQGKRSGRTVKGGMCGLMGTEQYEGIDLTTLPNFEDLQASPNRKRMNFHELYRYALANLAGCNHLESMAFAIINPD